MVQDVSLTYDGGWKSLHDIKYSVNDIKYSVSFGNFIKILQLGMLVLIFLKLCE